MKKLLALLLAGVMCVSMMACGAKEEPAEESEVSEETKEAASEVAEKAEEATAEDPLVVWFACAGSRGDHGTTDVTWAGLMELQEKYGDKIEINILEAGTDQSLYEAQFLEVLDGGCDIFTCSANYSMADLVSKYVNDYPDTVFWFTDMGDSYEFANPETCAGMSFKQNEVMFLSGALAASMSETGIIGFVGGMESTVICDFGAGYIAGAKYVNPDIKVIFSFVGNFDDSAKGKELALVQASMGADVIHNVAGTAGLGAMEGAAEAGIRCFGVDVDQYQVFMDKGDEATANSIITSSLKKWDVSHCLFIERYIEDPDSIKWGEIEPWGIIENGVGLCENDHYFENVPEEYQKLVDELEAKVVSGEIEVPTAMGLPVEEWEAMKQSVALE